MTQTREETREDRQLLDHCQPLDGTQGPAIPAQRKARREYENRVKALRG